MTISVEKGTVAMIGYRFSPEDGRSPNNPRMKAWVTIGEKRTMRGVIVPCKRGFHASPTPWDALQFATGPMFEVVELEGDLKEHGSPVDKWVGRTRTLLSRVDASRELRLFAADCAERVLPLFEAKYPADARPRLAIQAARDFANGLIGPAPADAARAAARAAAWDAARAAAWASSDAAWAAARVAAWAAARAAAWAAARAAERSWQREQFAQRFPVAAPVGV